MPPSTAHVLPLKRECDRAAAAARNWLGLSLRQSLGMGLGLIKPLPLHLGKDQFVSIFFLLL